MVTLILMFTSLLVQSYSVSSYENEDASVTPKGRYNFNHPPTVEDYNPILESIKYSEKDSEYKPRISKQADDSGDEFEMNDTSSVEIVTDTIRNVDADLIKNKHTPKGRAIEIEEEIPDVTPTNLTNSSSDEGLKSRRKSAVRKTKVQKRVIQKATKNENSFSENVDVKKLTNIQTSTLKPTLTTAKLINIPKVTTAVYSTNRRERDPVVPIVESENYVYAHNGKFHYSYVGGDGTKASEQGQLRVFDDKTAGEAVAGSFSYTDKDGNDFSLTYTADENGYRPVGDHLPTPPPIPPAIARALQYLSTKTSTEATTKI